MIFKQEKKICIFIYISFSHFRNLVLLVKEVYPIIMVYHLEHIYILNVLFYVEELYMNDYLYKLF